MGPIALRWFPSFVIRKLSERRKKKRKVCRSPRKSPQLPTRVQSSTPWSPINESGAYLWVKPLKIKTSKTIILKSTVPLHSLSLTPRETFLRLMLQAAILYILPWEQTQVWFSSKASLQRFRLLNPQSLYRKAYGTLRCFWLRFPIYI